MLVSIFLAVARVGREVHLLLEDCHVVAPEKRGIMDKKIIGRAK